VHRNSDLIERIASFNLGRDPERLQLKYKAMRKDAFAFLRGTCHLFYEDWPRGGSLNQAPLTWICGDLHLENFGAYKGDNRLTYFDLSDFDEAVLAPCTWDLARLLTSVLVAANALSIKHRDALRLCQQLLDTYAAALIAGKASWIERKTAQGMVKKLLTRVTRRVRAVFLDSRTDLKHGKRKIRLDGIHALAATTSERDKVEDFMRRFAQEQLDPSFFKVLDVARKIAGTGSLGIERYEILIRGRANPDQNFLLDLKLAPGSALAPYLSVPQPKWKSQAERVVAIQQRVQATSPAFLHAVTIRNKPYVLDELMPTQDKLQLAHWSRKLQSLEEMSSAMGQLVAWGQLRSSGRQGSATADELIGFGCETNWRNHILSYASHYSERVHQDWQTFRDAYRQGAFG
jgi:uncharacterized protein (DUF2252 family)